MKIDMNQTITNFDGTVLKDEQGREHTLGTICIIGLLNTPVKPGTKDEGTIKYERYKLAKKIDDLETAEMELSVEDVVMLKQIISEKFATIVVGQALDMLEGVKENGE